MFKSDEPLARTAVLGVLMLGCLQVVSGLKNPKGADVSSISTNSTSSDVSKDTLQVDSKSILLSKVYKEWSSWGTCSKGCQQSRKRRCKKELQCGKSYIKEKRKCKSKGVCSKRSKRKYVKLLGLRKSDKLVKQILYKILYSTWTPWTVCSRSCKKQRRRTCVQPAMCGASYIQEERQCKRSSLFCRKQYILGTFEKMDDKTDDMDESVRTIQNITNNIVNSTINTKFGPTGGDFKSKGAVLRRNTDSSAVGSYCRSLHSKKTRRRRIKVKVGEHDIYANDAGEMFIKLQADFPHPKYDYDTITDDIALLKLQKPVEASATVGFACLPEETDKLPEKHMCYILGWGKKKNTDVFGSTVLREARVPLVNRKTCQRAFNYPIHDTQVCAGSKNGGIDSCAGDSGGPLLCPKLGPGGVNKWMVYGVTSYGEGCGEKKKFGIYTKVRKYLDWINEVINDK